MQLLCNSGAPAHAMRVKEWAILGQLFDPPRSAPCRLRCDRHSAASHDRQAISPMRAVRERHSGNKQGNRACLCEKLCAAGTSRRTFETAKGSFPGSAPESLDDISVFMSTWSCSLQGGVGLSKAWSAERTYSLTYLHLAARLFARRASSSVRRWQTTIDSFALLCPS